MTDDSGSAQAAAEAFLHAVIWGEHTVVWDLLSPTGRRTALAVARHNGLDPVAAGRFESGLADPVELQAFQAELLAGLRRDLRSVDINEIRVSSVAIEGTESDKGTGTGEGTESDKGTGTGEGTAAGAGTVTAVARLTVPSALPGSDGWAAGDLHLSLQASGRWLVDRLDPRLARP